MVNKETGLNDKQLQAIVDRNMRISRQAPDGHWYRVVNQWDSEVLNNLPAEPNIEVWRGCSSEFREDYNMAELGFYDIWKPKN